MRPPAVSIMRSLGLEPDPWQIEVLESTRPCLLLNCSRQAGKSTVVALLGLVEAVWVPFTKVLLLSRSLRQAKLLYRLTLDFYRRIGQPLALRQTAHELELSNHSQIVCLPCNEETIRGYASINLLVIDEAARVPDDLYRAVRPMLAVSKGRLIALSTPYGKRGFFYQAWAHGGDDWGRVSVTADQVPRISADYLAAERRALGEAWFRQEYYCAFEAIEGLVYPSFDRCVVDKLPFAEPGRELTCQPPQAGTGRVGGLDFGFRNPFAAVWGRLDGDGVLWLTGEHYQTQRPLSHHARHIPRDVIWYADPAGANERAELRRANFVVKTGRHDLGPGIAAVSARLEDGTLRILEGRCPNLLREASLYRYSSDQDDRRAEAPHNEFNHALDALRYLIYTLDHRKPLIPPPPKPPPQEEDLYPRPAPLDDNAHWTPL